MGDMIMAAPVGGLASKERITPQDVLMLRREVFGNGVVTRGEAEALFALHSSTTEQCAEWGEFFVEAVTDYIVHQEKPEGYISARQCRLAGQGDLERPHGRHDGRARAPGEGARKGQVFAPACPPSRCGK